MNGRAGIVAYRRKKLHSDGLYLDLERFELRVGG
jgi:hypothetical protein